MKRNHFYPIVILIGLVLFSSCKKDDPADGPKDPQPSSSSAQKFLLLNYNSSNALGPGAYISLLEIKNGAPVITKLNDFYPLANLNSNVDITKNRAVMGLHSDFNTDGSSRRTVGVWFDVPSTSTSELPLLPAGTGRYAYFGSATGKVSENGNIFYLSCSNDASYHDQYRAALVRYNPSSSVLEQAQHPDAFILAQPERGWDTETGQYKGDFYPSPDGRYVYGVIEAFGVDGGSLHWDYEILFKYDFQTQTYTRLGDAEDSHVLILGITSDRTQVFYNSQIGSVSKKKIVNTATNTTKPVTITGGQGYKNTSRWNANGYCSGETNRTIGVYDVINDSKHNVTTQADPNYAQFSSGGDAIYFMLKSSQNNYLCKTSNTSASAKIDTVCTLSKSIYEFMVVK